MSKFSTFLSTFRNSSFKPNYYNDVLKAPFSFSLKYFLCLFFTLSFLTTFSVSIFLIQKVNPYLSQLKTTLPNLYPDELHLTIKDGQVSTNVQEPYFLPLKPEIFPQEFKDALKGQTIIQNILVIDTQAQPGELKKYQTFILLTKDSVSFLGDRSEIRIQSLDEVKNLTINKIIINQIWKTITPYFPWILPVMIIGLFLFIPFFTILGKFIYLVFISLITFILGRLFKHGEINYLRSLQINLHAITLPTVIIALFQLFGALPKVPFFGTIILLIFNLIIFTSLKEASSPSTPSK